MNDCRGVMKIAMEKAGNIWQALVYIKMEVLHEKFSYNLFFCACIYSQLHIPNWHDELYGGGWRIP
jgi:hypothetical protein